MRRAAAVLGAGRGLVCGRGVGESQLWRRRECEREGREAGRTEDKRDVAHVGAQGDAHKLVQVDDLVGRGEGALEQGAVGPADADARVGPPVGPVAVVRALGLVAQLLGQEGPVDEVLAALDGRGVGVLELRGEGLEVGVGRGEGEEGARGGVEGRGRGAVVAVGEGALLGRVGRVDRGEGDGAGWAGWRLGGAGGCDGRRRRRRWGRGGWRGRGGRRAGGVAWEAGQHRVRHGLAGAFQSERVAVREGGRAAAVSSFGSFVTSEDLRPACASRLLLCIAPPCPPWSAPAARPASASAPSRSGAAASSLARRLVLLVQPDRGASSPASARPSTRLRPPSSAPSPPCAPPTRTRSASSGSPSTSQTRTRCARLHNRSTPAPTRSTRSSSMLPCGPQTLTRRASRPAGRSGLRRPSSTLSVRLLLLLLLAPVH